MRISKLCIYTGLLMGLAACAPMADKSAPADMECTPVHANDPLIGNWLSIGSQKGVAGALRTMYTLNVDGSMDFQQQIKRGQAPSQGIHESGCWYRIGNTLTIKTDKSNGLPVNLDDPIYTSKYQIIGLNKDELQLQGDTGSINAKRMSPGYRLPF